MLSSEICEIFKNTYFEEHLPTTDSVYLRPVFLSCRNQSIDWESKFIGWFLWVEQLPLNGVMVENGLRKKLAIFFPMFPFDPPENIRKPLVFWCFQGDQKGTFERKRLIMVVNLERWLEEYIHIFEKYFRDVFGTLLNI